MFLSPARDSSRSSRAPSSPRPACASRCRSRRPAKTKSDFQTEQASGASLVATVISAAAFLAGWVEKRVRERGS